MRSSPWLAGAALVVTLGLGAALIAGQRAPRATTETAASNPQTEQLRAEVAVLKASLQRLSAQHETRPPSSVSPEAPSAAKVEPPQPVETAARSEALTLEEVLAGVPSEQKEDFLRDLDRKQSRARKARTLETLRSEPRDATWTREVEDMISNATASLDRKEFPTARVTSIECGSTLCKIEVDQDNASEHPGFPGALHTGLRTFALRRGGPDDPPGERLGWTLFVARKGHKMPKVPLEEVLAMDG
jgi:hypothetical protein